MFENGIEELVVLKPTMKNYNAVFVPCECFQILQVFSCNPVDFNKQLDKAIIQMNEK